MRRLEQIMGEVSNYAPPDKVHAWQEEIEALIWREKRQNTIEVYHYLESIGVWVQPH